MISTTALRQAFISLSKAMDRASREPADLEIRDACIQRFEYTYELSIKIIKRYIEFEMPVSENVDQLNYRDLLRIAFEMGLIHGVPQWFQFREARNQTSHAYDENKAHAVFQVIPSFIDYAQFLLDQLDTRLRKSS